MACSTLLGLASPRSEKTWTTQEQRQASGGTVVLFSLAAWMFEETDSQRRGTCWRKLQEEETAVPALVQFRSDGDRRRVLEKQFVLRWCERPRMRDRPWTKSILCGQPVSRCSKAAGRSDLQIERPAGSRDALSKVYWIRFGPPSRGRAKYSTAKSLSRGVRCCRCRRDEWQSDPEAVLDIFQSRP